MVKNGTHKTCPVCSKEFYVIPSQEKKGRGKFCSVQCKANYQETQESGKKGKTYPHLQRAEVKECRTCGKEFRAVNDKYCRKQVYCGHTCYVKGNRVSRFEETVFEYLVNINGQLIRQVKKCRLSFDMAIDGTNILIEADGSYWHSQPHVKARDERKNVWCKENGFELYRIDELTFYKSKEIACQVIIDRMLKLDPSLIITRNGQPYAKTK